MTSTKRILNGLTLAALLATVHIGLCQNTPPFSLSVTDVASIGSLSNDQLAALLNALGATPQISCDALPRNGTLGNFFSLQHPDWPPLPWDSSQSSVWQMAGFYLMNDVTYDYDAVSAISLATRPQARMGATADDGLTPPGAGSGGDNGGGALPNYPPLAMDTNRLGLQIVAMTNQTASLVIHPAAGVSNDVYELLYSTNLLVPRTNWQWVLRSYPQETNLIVPNASDAQGFYQLRSPGDLVANDSLGTNFWLAFCGLYTDGSNRLSLIISSPLGATGTVTTPGLLTNAPVLIVTNCGDDSLNGTYTQRNLTADEQAAWAAIPLAPIYTGYIRGTNWVVVYGGYCYVVAYDSLATNCTILYQKGGTDLNGTTSEWTIDPSGPETNSPPATICAQVLLINQSFSLAAGTATNITVPLAAMTEAYDAVQTNGIHIAASQPVSVYGLDYDPTASTAFTGYPTTLLGTNYCVLTRAASLPIYSSQAFSDFGIVATADNTTVWITPSPTADLVGYGTNAYSTNLPAGGTYQIESQDSDGDVTGTWITSDKPAAVFAGANGANVPDATTQSPNPLMQEQMPVESWGKEVLALSFAGRMNGDTYRILAAYSNTVATITGKVVTIVDEPNDGINPWSVTTSNETVLATITNAGEYYDIIVDGPVEFQATQPIQVAQFANGCYSDVIFNDPNSLYPEGDPGEILLPPVGHCLETNIVVTLPNDNVSGDFDENYLNIIVVQSAITNTIVDGSTVAVTNFVAIGTSGYYGAQIIVTNSGVHKVISSQPIAVEVYGFGPADAYGYFGGIVK